MKKEDIIGPCSGMAIDAKAGQNIMVVDIEGGQVVDSSQKALKLPMNSFPPE